MRDKTTLATKPTARSDRNQAVSADLIAVVIAVTDGKPRLLTVGEAGALPSGPFELGHRSLQLGLRAWVERQTGHPLGYIEQLYTFADRDRIGEEHVQRVISISYLALTREEQADEPIMHSWRSWYDYFPWEDHRAGVPAIVPDILMPRLRAWADEGSDPDMRHDRLQRASIAFGLDGRVWNEELALQRYELLYEAELVAEAKRSGNTGSAPSIAGRAMIADHRRILATGIARLRTKIKYRPVVFELMPPTFTLLQLQRTVEALAGRLVHKPNFRRLIEEQDLIEETGETMSDTGGRPAKRFRFRQTVLAERTVAGTKMPLSRV
ncbi:MAG: hypothetical protein E5W19_28380 [Mesorhizobium sp.]|nr:MAG: hypothetical protein E5W19_28380 [Mesorhizobium sp.]